MSSTTAVAPEVLAARDELTRAVLAESPNTDENIVDVLVEAARQNWQDEEAGGADFSPGLWAGLFRAEAAVVSTDHYGFWSVDTFPTVAEAEAEFSRLSAELDGAEDGGA